MADSGFHTIGRWAAAAAGAGVLALALVQPAFGAHRGFWPAGNGAFAAHAQIRPRHDGVGRMRAPMVAAAPGTSWWRVSDDARGAPRTADNNVYMRAGSIRADIARYNEERAGNRFTPRQPAQHSAPNVPGSWFFRN